MGERTQHQPGTMSWADLTTPDPEAAKAFYGELFGWAFDDMPVDGGGTYSMASLDGASVAALAGQPEQDRSNGIPPHWNNYVTVDDLEASSARAAELGGTVVLPPFDVMTAGRMTVIQDPSGGHLALWEPRDHIGATRVNEPGCLTWNDFVTQDPAAAQEFFGSLFGWTYERMPTDEVEYYVCRNGERGNGGLMKAREEGIPSFWYPYFAVEDVDATRAKIESAGGRVMAGPTEVPTGRFVVATDPQGAFFAIYEGDFED
jgi:predicted enzyme related to lactoylglutathione lyase